MNIVKATPEQVEKFICEISTVSSEHLRAPDCYDLKAHPLGASFQFMPKRPDRESFPHWIIDKMAAQFGLWLGNTLTLVGVWSTDACAMCHEEFGRHGSPKLFDSKYAPTEMRDKYIHHDCLMKWADHIYESENV